MVKNQIASHGDTSYSRVELIQIVKQQVILSISLSYARKDKLIKQLPKLTEEQLKQLKIVFDNESERKEQMLGDLFYKQPELYSEFERLSREHVNSIYEDVESGEKAAEEKIMNKLITTSF